MPGFFGGQADKFSGPLLWKLIRAASKNVVMISGAIPNGSRRHGICFPAAIWGISCPPTENKQHGLRGYRMLMV
jgi:hypothetical protein